MIYVRKDDTRVRVLHRETSWQLSPEHVCGPWRNTQYTSMIFFTSRCNLRVSRNNNSLSNYLSDRTYKFSESKHSIIDTLRSKQSRCKIDIVESNNNSIDRIYREKKKNKDAKIKEPKAIHSTDRSMKFIDTVRSMEPLKRVKNEKEILLIERDRPTQDRI